jgi:RNA-directed DNA polymerase
LIAKSTAIKGRGGKSDGRAAKAVDLTSGGLRCCPGNGTAGVARRPDRSAVAKPSVRKFLGFSFTSGRQPRRRIAPQAIDRFKARVRELTRRTCGKSLSQVAKELSRYLIGWRGYFGFCETPSVLRELDQWTRRRLRAIAWKQWKRGRTRFARLRRRGVGRDLAAQTAGSPHGPWRLSNSLALTIALPNVFLGSLGLATLATKHAA